MIRHVLSRLTGLAFISFLPEPLVTQARHASPWCDELHPDRRVSAT